MEQTPTQNKLLSMFSGRRGRDLKEYLTAYLFIAPSVFLIFVFGIFPVGFALFVSVHKWQLVRGEFRGLRNYVNSVGDFIYVGLFFLALGALWYAYRLIVKTIEEAREADEKPWALTIPSALHAVAVIGLLRWVYLQLPEMLDIAIKLRGVERTREIFLQFLEEAFRAETVYPAWQQFTWVFLAAVVLGVVAFRWWGQYSGFTYQVTFMGMWLGLLTGVALLWVTYTQVQAVYAAALETGESPQTWSHIITISAGIVILALGWRLWQGMEQAGSDRSFVLRGIGALLLAGSGMLLAFEVPQIMAAGDQDVWQGLRVTVFYSVGTVPIQLSIALFLSILLFQKLRGSEFFRILFFLPYITPAVASAAVFKQMFSSRQQAPINAIYQFLGWEPQLWSREPSGIFTMAAEKIGLEGFPAAYIPTWIPEDLGSVIADWATGPSMALTVIIIYSIWVYVGYDTVIYLAGLGNIPTEMTEAAEIDGATKWQVFRYITFPLLSPTTYFLSLIAIIGTFKAFNHIWIMRTGEALGTTDPFSVVIFEEFFNKTRYGYASALAFVLFAIILGLTYVNNKIQGSRVFYG